MEEKIVEFMEKMYADLKSEIKSVKNELKTVGNQVTKLNLSIENEIKPSINALLDGYKQLAEGQEEIRSELSDIKEHMVNQDNEIALLKAER